MSTVEELLYSNYIKYDRLSRLCGLFKPNTFMDIYIDMYSMVKGLYNRNDIQIMIPTTIVSSVINLCAHYRWYLSSLGIDTTFYIVNSQNISELNKKFYPEYNSKIEYAYSMDKRMDELVFSNIDLLQTLCQYLPDIHFIESVDGYETGAIMNYIMDTVNNDNTRYNVIITRDIYNYQLCQRDNTFILRPKKTKDGDMSYIINKDNVMKIFLWERKSSIIDTTLDPGLLSIVMALSNLPERNIKSLLNTNVSIDILEDAIRNYRLSNSYNFHTNSIWTALCNIPQIFNVGETIIDHRIKAIDTNFQSSVYSNTLECGMLRFENLYDPKNVIKINETYFVNNPLNLECL